MDNKHRRWIDEVIEIRKCAPQDSKPEQRGSFAFPNLGCSTEEVDVEAWESIDAFLGILKIQFAHAFQTH